MKNQYRNGFPIPKPDSFGICNNYDSAHFMMDDESSCVQMVDLETECANILNAKYYSENLKYFLGQGGSSSDQQTVIVDEVYTYDETTAKYEK